MQIAEFPLQSADWLHMSSSEEAKKLRASKAHNQAKLRAHAQQWPQLDSQVATFLTQETRIKPLKSVPAASRQRQKQQQQQRELPLCSGRLEASYLWSLDSSCCYERARQIRSQLALFVAKLGPSARLWIGQLCKRPDEKRAQLVRFERGL